MSLIVDLEEADARRLFPLPAPRREIEFKTVRYRRWVARRDRRLWIERDTPIVPGVLADDVCGEISRWLGVELPRSWRVRLAVRADVIYHHNRQFRQGVRRRGRGGVDYLRMFMRHWLAAMLHRRQPEWYERVPASYARGADLPERVPSNGSRQTVPGRRSGSPGNRLISDRGTANPIARRIRRGTSF
jgi:hypothetical protein